MGKIKVKHIGLLIGILSVLYVFTPWPVYLCIPIGLVGLVCFMVGVRHERMAEADRKHQELLEAVREAK